MDANTAKNIADTVVTYTTRSSEHGPELRERLHLPKVVRFKTVEEWFADEDEFYGYLGSATKGEKA